MCPGMRLNLCPARNSSGHQLDISYDNSYRNCTTQGITDATSCDRPKNASQIQSFWLDAGCEHRDRSLCSAARRLPQPNQVEPNADASTLTEVVVTANKLNAQKVLDVPASIQAISGDALQAAGASGIMSIAGDVPGLSIQDLGPGDKKYVIRGINSTGELDSRCLLRGGGDQRHE